MRNIRLTISLTILVSLSLKTLANDAYSKDNKELLDSFHQMGVTKCDQFIIENSGLKGNWYYYINSHREDIDTEIKEVSVVQILGTKNDTIKIDHSYIQTPTKCYLHKKSTITFAGPCSSVIDQNYWYVSKELKNKDYTEYTNSGGAKLYAKEINVGNFKACIQEYDIRNQWNIK